MLPQILKKVVIGSNLEKKDDLITERNYGFNYFDEVDTLNGETLLIFVDIIFDDRYIFK